LIPILVAALQEEHAQKEALKVHVENQHQTIKIKQSKIINQKSQVSYPMSQACLPK